MRTSSGEKRPTIGDVAALAGVSKGAVSRAFNGGVRISPATVQRIQEAAATLGWVPSSAARAINGAPAHAIGLVVRRPAELLEHDPFFPAFLAGIESVLSRHRYAAIMRFVSSARDERECYTQLVAERRVDGFLINDLRRADPRLRMLRELSAPAVVVGSPKSSSVLPSVDTAADDSIRTLIETLLRAGHRNIAHVAGPPELLHSGARLALWRTTVEAAGLDADNIVVGDFTAIGGAAATREIIARKPRPTAIFYGSDVMAIAGIAALSAMGLRVPEDVAVAGFDDISLASFASPALSTVHCDYNALGKAAADLLLRQIGGEQVPRRTELPSEVRLRQSTSVTRGSRAEVVHT